MTAPAQIHLVAPSGLMVVEAGQTGPREMLVVLLRQVGSGGDQIMMRSGG